MDDAAIIELYWLRDEGAIEQTRRRYGERLRGISFNILRSREDAEENEFDTYMKTWEAIPPRRPTYFFAFLAKICRNLSLHRLERKSAGKRAAVLVELTEELAQCLPDPAGGAGFEELETADLLNSFLRTLPRESRVIFVLRYGLAESVGDIARRLATSESKVKSSLFRTRNRLRAYLAQEGVSV